MLPIVEQLNKDIEIQISNGSKNDFSCTQIHPEKEKKKKMNRVGMHSCVFIFLIYIFSQILMKESNESLPPSIDDRKSIRFRFSCFYYLSLRLVVDLCI